MAPKGEIKPEEIKLQLDDILTQVAKSQNIENFDLNSDINANYGDGFVAQFFLGEIINKENGESTHVAIKKAPESDFDISTLFKNEDLFYKTAFPALQKLQKNCGILEIFDNVPKYFYGNIEPKKEFIAMENVKLLGYTMFDKMQYFNEEHLEFIFMSYAKFHALSFVLRKTSPEEYQEITKGFYDLNGTLVEYIGKQMASALSATVEILNTEEHKIMYDVIKDLGENFPQLFSKALEYNGEYSCLVHGDCWSNNMLFKYSEDGKLLNMKLIDFQLTQDDTPIHDLSYFFYSGASKKDFDNLENYLQIYYKTFIAFAQELGCDSDKLFSFEVLKNEWKENALLGVLFGIWLWEVKLIPKEEILVMIKEHQHLSTEEQMKIWQDYVKKVHASDLYRERTTPILIHAFEYGILTRDKIVQKEED